MRRKGSTRIPSVDITTEGHLRVVVPPRSRKRTHRLKRSGENSPGCHPCQSRVRCSRGLTPKLDSSPPHGLADTPQFEPYLRRSKDSLPGGDTTAQFTIRASRIGCFCFLSFFFFFFLTKKISRKYFAVPFGRRRRRPISSERAKSFILFARIPFEHWVPVRSWERLHVF